MAVDDEASWRAAAPVDVLSGIADAAFVNDEGTVFARVGEDWTVQVATTGDWQPPLEHTVELVRRIVRRLSTAPPPDQPAFPASD